MQQSCHRPSQKNVYMVKKTNLKIGKIGQSKKCEMVRKCQYEEIYLLFIYTKTVRQLLAGVIALI